MIQGPRSSSQKLTLNYSGIESSDFLWSFPEVQVQVVRSINPQSHLKISITQVSESDNTSPNPDGATKKLLEQALAINYHLVIMEIKPILGLRTKHDLEKKKFVKYFEFVQQEASKKGYVFFLDSQDSFDVEYDGMIVFDMYGWYIRKDSKDCEEFIRIFENFEEKNQSYWSKYCLFCEYEIKDGKLSVRFVDYGY